ncbi:uncharacterized protein LOC132758961 [Ruditapes philippinarum]|uniref:uncharacterized protein LOC132758961 n=1 Tax=Ruditapes philippinarum TaxID=129788 RepID=UPI00295A973D|nr:uncharacterized protein LOC132758961 [Ruditapes philippinarum]
MAHILVTSVLSCIFIICVNIANGQLNWTDCKPNEFADPIYVHSLIVSPLPIRLPGVYNVSFDAVVSSYIDELVIEVDIGWRNRTSGEMEKVFPEDENKSLRVYDACYVINKILFSDPSAIANDIDVHIDKLLVDALRYHAGCPLLAGRMTISSQPIQLPVNIIPMNALRSDRYAVKINFKNRRNKLLGCIQFHAPYGGQVIN